MGALIELEKGDVILCKDGREMQVLSIYKPDGTVRRCDCVEVGVDTPMRTPIWAENISKILRKAPQKPPQPADVIPPEQKVGVKDPVPQAVKDDVAHRQAETKKSVSQRKAD